MRYQFTLNPATDNKLIEEPIGWKSIKLSLEREKNKHGIFFDYSQDLQFFNSPKDSSKDAYDFLKAAYEAYGVEAEVLMEVELACGDDGAFESQGVWRLDFTSYSESIEDGLCLITLSMESADTLMVFRNRYNQAVDMATEESFEGSALGPYTGLPQLTSIPPVQLLQMATLNSPIGEGRVFTGIAQSDTVPAGGGTIVIGYDNYGQFELSPGKGYDSLEPNNLDEIATRFRVTNTAYEAIADFKDPNYQFEYGGEYEFQVRLTFAGNVFIDTDAPSTDCGGDQNTFTDVFARIILSVGGTDYTLWEETDTGCFEDLYAFTGTGGAVEITINHTVAADDEMSIYIQVGGSGEWNRGVAGLPIDWSSAFASDVDVTIRAKTEKVATEHDLFLINEVGSRILEAITDDQYRLLSNYYGRSDSEPYAAPDGTDGVGGLRGLTQGLILRNDDSLGNLTISFKELFDNLNALDNIGIGLEDDPSRAGFKVLRMEPMAYFYDPTVMIQLDKVPRVTRKPTPDEHFSIFKFGFSRYEAEAFLGLDEFNTEREYRTELEVIDNTLTQICKFVASGYAVELTRRIDGSSDGTREDWRFDEDQFVICLKRDTGSLIVEQGNIVGSSNIESPTSIINFRISPNRNALRWLKRILATYRDPEAAESVLKFVSGSNNVIASGLMTGLDPIAGAILAENQTLSLSDFGDEADGKPVYIPEEWVFEFPLSWEDYNTIKADPRGVVEARFGQQTEYSQFYLRKLEYMPNEGKAEWTLLPAKFYPLDECCFYIVNLRTNGTDQISSPTLVGAALEDLFIYVNGKLAKYNDTVALSNEIESWDSTTGTVTFRVPISAGREIRIVHIPAMICDDCIYRFEGQGDGLTTITLTGFAGVPLSDIFLYYNGNLLKYNDTVAANNEIASYVPAVATVQLTFPTQVGREIRAFAFSNC